MTPTAEMPFVVIEPGELAQWLEAQPETWWTVDGDPLLMSETDLPCPAPELSAILRKYPKNILVFAPGSSHHGEQITGGQLNALSHLDRRNERNFLMRWEDGDEPWLLSEDTIRSQAMWK